VAVESVPRLQTELLEEFMKRRGARLVEADAENLVSHFQKAISRQV
jgi:hypothetical protein